MQLINKFNFIELKAFQLGLIAIIALIHLIGYIELLISIDIDDYFYFVSNETIRFGISAIIPLIGFGHLIRPCIICLIKIKNSFNKN